MPVSCAHCGLENREGARFCRNCGQPLQEVAPAQVTPSVPPSANIDDDTRAIPAATMAESPHNAEASATTVPEMAGLSEPGISPTAGEVAAEVAPQAAELAAVESSSTTAPDTTPSPAEMIGTTVAASLRDEQAVSSALEQRLMDAEPTPGPVNAPLETGTILQERYRIVGVLAQEPEATLYEAEDLRMCWNCSALQADVEGQFCEACGAERVKKPMLRLRETFLIGEPEYAEGGGRFQQNERLYVVEAVFVTAATARQQGLRLVAGYQSDPGKVRDIDEDSVLVLQFAAVCEARSAPTLAFFAVADGIGGHAAGEVASRAAIRSLTEELLRRVFLPAIGGEVLLPESLASHLVEAVHVANEVVLAIRQQKQSDMGSTLTAALVYEAQAIVTSVGDSRTYLMRSGKLAQVTRDHSVVASLIAAGLAKPEEIYTHEKKSVIYRSLGDKPDLEVDTFALTLEPGDRLLLCCDGLWELVRDSIIEDVLLEQPDPQAACDKLVELANQSGGDDNISVIVINVQRLAPIQ